MEIIAFLPLLWMIRSDFNERTIGIYPLVAFGLIIWGVVVVEMGGREYVQRLLLNSLLIGLLIVGVALYLILRYGKSLKSLQHYCGYGDLGFLFCLAPAFELLTFTWFLVISFSVSVVCCLLIPSWRVKGVPLVSTIGICFIVFICCRLFCKM